MGRLGRLQALTARVRSREEFERRRRRAKPANVHAAALASLPTWLARSASIARKAERRQKKSAQFATLRTRALYYIPVLDWLPAYTLQAFAGDVASAFTVSLSSFLSPTSSSRRLTSTALKLRTRHANDLSQSRN